MHTNALLAIVSAVPAIACLPGVEESAARAPGSPSTPPNHAQRPVAIVNHRGERPFDHAHSGFTRVLAAHVQGDLVDYAALSADHAALDEYISHLASIDPQRFAGWSDDQRFAFWTNAYNAYTLRAIVEAYPLASIRDIEKNGKEIWDVAWLPLGPLVPDLGREQLSLNDVEHEILRKRFRDPRVHAAVNCASLSCPALAGEAFRADRLDEQLDARVRAWIADESRNRFSIDANRASVSKIFEWFREDFEREAGGVLTWIARYAPEETARWLASAEGVKLEFLDYDWELNAVR